MRATADAVVVEPAVVGDARPSRTASPPTRCWPAARGWCATSPRRARAADERGQRLLTFAIEAEVGFEQPVDLERFADALADRIAELAAEFGPGQRRYRVLVGGHPA